MSNHVRYKTFDQLSFADLIVYSKLPPHPFWSNVEQLVDFSFADTVCSVLYSGKGQRPYAPSLKLKIHLVQSYLGTSDRRTEEEIMANLHIKRFLQLPVDFFGFDHSTIGLDRSRMGESMFRACHLYILAQLYQHGLWGDRDEKWIIDSFPTNVHLARPGAYRLIQHATIRLVKHLRKYGTQPMLKALETLPLDAVGVRIGKSPPPAKRLLAFSKLVVQAYGLLTWFDSEHVKPLLEKWEHGKRSQELQDTLKRILEENSRPVDPQGGPKERVEETVQSDEAKAESSEPITYEKIPRAERPKDRIISAVDPQARVVKRSLPIIGYKTQNLCTSTGVILDVRTIPANEHDQHATADMVSVIQQLFGVTPSALLCDAAYGHGWHRELLASKNIRVVAPLPANENPKGLFSSSEFRYDADKDVYTCPGGQQSVQKRYIRQLKGHQYYFEKQACHSCPLRSQCTSSKEHGRRVFRSDFEELYEAVRQYNESITGKAELQQRLIVERKNKELKNDCGLNRIHTRSRAGLQTKALTAAMVVNLKLIVRRKATPKPGFIRRARKVAG